MKRMLIMSAAAMLAWSPMVLAQAGSEAAKPAQKAEMKKLTVGDKAPALTVEKWVKGAPIKEFQKGHVYVVEFWATWCGPCIKAFPHLSELQKEHKDHVTIIGTNIWERGGYSEATLTKVEDFVTKQGDKMAYTVAYDGGAKQMDQNWMRAAGRNGIPSAFVVDKEGVIAWIGNPAYPPGQMDEAIEQIVKGSWDMGTAKKQAADEAAQEAAEQELNQFAMDYQKAIKTKEYDKAYEMANKAMDGKAKDIPMLLNLIAWMIVDPELKVEKQDLNLAMKAAERANELTKSKDPGILDTLARVHYVKGNKDKAIELQTKAVELAPEQMKAELEKALAEYKEGKR